MKTVVGIGVFGGRGRIGIGVRERPRLDSPERIVPPVLVDECAVLAFLRPSEDLAIMVILVDHSARARTVNTLAFDHHFWVLDMPRRREECVPISRRCRSLR